MNIYFVNEGVMHLKYMMVDFSLGLVVPRLLFGGGGKRTWYTLFVHVRSYLGNLQTTPLHSIHLLRDHTARLYTL